MDMYFDNHTGNTVGGAGPYDPPRYILLDLDTYPRPDLHHIYQRPLWDENYNHTGWHVPPEVFDKLVRDAVAERRDAHVNGLWDYGIDDWEIEPAVAKFTANTYKKVGSSFELDEEDVELHLHLNAVTEASLFTKAHVTPNSPEPKPYERYKFVNKNVYVSRQDFARALMAIDEKRQPYFDAEGAVIDQHELTPFTSVQDAVDALDAYVGYGA